MIGGDAHEPYGVIAISMPSRFARRVNVDHRQFAQVLSGAYENVTDLGQ